MKSTEIYHNHYFGVVKEAVIWKLRLIGTELDGYVVQKIISPIRYSHNVTHYTHCLFALISDQVAKWFEINIKNVRKLCSFASLLNLKSWNKSVEQKRMCGKQTKWSVI